MTDYERDLGLIEAELEVIGSAVREADAVFSADSGNVVRILYKKFQYAALSGELTLLQPLDELLDGAIRSSRHPTDLWLLKAHVALNRHRLADAAAALRADPSLRASSPARLLWSDIYLQHGEYSSARSAIEAVLSEGNTWDALARLAHLTSLIGDWRTADELYAAAEDELTAKQMQMFAWLEVQRGWMHFQRGHQDEARLRYDRADAAYSGYWLVEERKAELIGAQGRFEEAVAVYGRLHTLSDRPEWQHALGDLYSLSGDAKRAYQWRCTAHTRYVESVSRGETYYFHYLSDLCCELAGREGEAVEWARRDVSIRGNFLTYGHLAWALYRCGEVSAAMEWMGTALASGAVSAHLFVRAACIYAAANQVELGSRYMQLAMSTNPHPPKGPNFRPGTQPLRIARMLRSSRITLGQTVA
jgi:tetratricopeptide (TPR) repeat protein